MSQAVGYNTSTWSAPAPRRGQSVRVSSPNWREANDSFAVQLSGARVDNRFRVLGSIMEFQHVPGIALGLTTPTTLRAQAQKTKAFVEALQTAAYLAADLVANDEIEEPNLDVWKSATLKMFSYASQTTAPLIYPLQMGGISFEWHDVGLNIEIRFRGEHDIFVVIEDAQNETPEFYGNDLSLLKVAEALDILLRRQA